ncbi:hypothetical protein K6U27_10875 [Vibrio fluvialis]|uniref:hypothetical protein n=1 Tax=Vibrio fluvialis TaxID=676 RepID=UPI001EEC9E50|nr:hypothetical protein [Vibrio fluvialis]MCG6373175.1 hypothetical protein [Vibrio fluvialis]
MTLDQVNLHAMNLDNWIPATEVHKRYPQFTQPTIKNLFWKRNEKPGLSRCYRQVGKKGFVNIPLFSLWLAGALPEQKAAGEN